MKTYQVTYNFRDFLKGDVITAEFLNDFVKVTIIEEETVLLLKYNQFELLHFNFLEEIKENSCVFSNNSVY